MFSKIVKLVPNEEITFQHLGEIYNGVETPQNFESGTENYILTETKIQRILPLKFRL
jgi:hypothetical protein